MKNKNESAWTIPQDWLLPSGQWTCYKILWPKSSAWQFLLSGVLYSLSRGREWDAETGTIKTAQEIGWEIFDRNYPLVLCGDVEPCEECSPEPQNGPFGGLSEIGVGEMPCIDISSMLRIENGVLQARDSCCEWVDIGAIAGLNEGVNNDPLNPGGDPGFVYSACGKAKAIVDAVYLTVQAGYSAIAEPYPWQLIPYVEDTVGYDLDNNQLIGMFAEITAGLVLGIEQSDVNDAVERQRILCRVVGEFEDDAVGVTTSEKFEAIKGCFKSEMFPFSLWWGMYEYAINAIGRVDMDTIAKFGAGSATENCDCPAEEIPEPFFGVGIGFSWRYVYDFRTGANGFTLVGNTHQNGTGLWAENQVTDHISVVVANRALENINNGSTLLMVGLIWTNVGDEVWNTEVEIGVNNFNGITMSDVTAMGGTNPATAGTFTFIKSVNHALGAGDDEIRLQLQAEHATDVSQKLVAVLFAGSGTGPMSA